MNTNFQLTLYEHPEHIFPTLKADQIARFSACGKSREVQRGQILVEQGDQSAPFFLVISGEMEVGWPTAKGEQVGCPIFCTSEIVSVARKVS